MAWPYDDDLISKLRSNINNGFSIGMSGKDRVALADLANLQARLNPNEAEDILGHAADDISFGQRGDRSSLAALMKIGNGVEFRALGGPVLPGQKYVVGENEPEIFVPETPGNVIPLSALNNPATRPFSSSLADLVNGGTKTTPPQLPNQPHTNLADFLARGLQPPNVPSLAGLSNPQNITAYTQGSNGYNPIRTDANGVTNWDKIPMSLAQVNALDTGWNALPVNQGPQQDINTIPVSAGGRVGTYANLADLSKGAIQDKLDAGNAMYGQNPYTMTQQERGGNETQSLANLRGSLDRNATIGENALVRAQSLMEIANRNNDRAFQVAMIKAASSGNKGGASGRSSAYNSVSDEDAMLIEKGIAEGRIDPQRINSRTAKIFASMERAGQGRTDYVGASGNVKYQNNSTNLNSRALAEGVRPLYDKLLVAGKALGNSSIPGVNRVTNWAKEQTGNPEIVAFNNLRDDVIAESERVLLGSGVLSDSKYLRAVKNVNSAQSYPQLKAAVKQLGITVDARLHALDIKPFKNRSGGNESANSSPPQGGGISSSYSNLLSKHRGAK